MNTLEDYNRFLAEVRKQTGIEAIKPDDSGLASVRVDDTYIEPESETVVYNYFFDFDRAAGDPEDFVDTLEKILQLCDLWAERIKERLSGGGDAAADDSAPHPMMMV